MFSLEDTSWVQHYASSGAFTLRCTIPDNPDTFNILTSAINQVAGHIGPVSSTGPESGHKVRDVTVYLSEKSQLDKLLTMTEPIEGLKVVGITDGIDRIIEIHRRGSIEVVSRVPLKSQTDLRMLYTPGVASVCEEVKKNPAMAWELTGICDRVAIVTNGTAVLGLGNIGLLPSLPVMEGKAAIMAEFVGVSGFPVLIDTKDIDTFVETVVRIASGFGAIQLEDVAAPACFEIEERLKAKLNIPVFHDDQHGTATVVLAALMSALKQTSRRPDDCSVLILGAGASGLAVSQILLGFAIGDIVIYDSRGPLYRGRTESMNPYKQHLAEITNKNNQKGTLAEAFAGKDIFIGLSRPNIISKDMIASMAEDPIVFPLSNPIGEISKEEAIQAGAAIAADGRDINNALAYPGIFRGALDARATEINMSMKLAAAEELANMALPNELLPDILDRAVHKQVAKAVAAAWQRA